MLFNIHVAWILKSSFPPVDTSAVPPPNAPSPRSGHLHVEGNAGHLAVNVEGALQLQKVPVLLNHLHARARLAVLADDVIEKHDLRQLHSQVVLVPGGGEGGGTVVRGEKALKRTLHLSGSFFFAILPCMWNGKN